MNIPQMEKDIYAKLGALYGIANAVDKMRRNYPVDSVEQEVFTRVLRYCEILRGMIKGS